MEEQNNTNTEEVKDKRQTRVCKYCKQEYKTQTGLKNWKNLFNKPTLDDWITLFIMILLIVASYAYFEETKQCRETMSNLDNVCLQYTRSISNTTYTEVSVNYPYYPALPNATTNTTTTNATTNTSTNTSGQIGGEK